jgi:hypothetical protein
MAEHFDLFGDPVPANRGGRGRPQHLPTHENRNKVSMLLALGWSNERIAAALNVTQPTLRKHYFSELKFRDVARDRLNAAFMMKVWNEADAGNVGAMRLFAQLVDKNDIAVGHDSFYGAQRREAEEERPAKLGKKEQAAAEAETAGQGTGWGDDLIPHGKH